MNDCYGPDFSEEFFSETFIIKVNHFFCGGKERVVERRRNICKEKFNNCNVVGTYSFPSWNDRR